MMITIWHNNRCGKSREAKAILEEANLEFEVFEYLKNDFSKEELLRLMAQLQIKDIKDMLRHKESEYKDLDKSSSEFEKYEAKARLNLINKIYKNFDDLLNQKYKVELNQKTIERVKNSF